MLTGLWRLARIANLAYSSFGTYPVCENSHKLRKFEPKCPKCGSQVIIKNPKSDQDYFLVMYSLNPSMLHQFLQIAFDEEMSKQVREKFDKADYSKKTKFEKSAGYIRLRADEMIVEIKNELNKVK